MRILQASTVHPMSDNRITYKHSIALTEAGYEVHVAGRPPTPQVGRLRFHPLEISGGRLRRAVTGSRLLWQLIRKLRPDAVQLHDPELIPLGIALRVLTRRKVIFDLHEDLPAQLLTKAHVPAYLRRPASSASRLLLKAITRCYHAVVIAEPGYAPLVGSTRVWLVQNFPWLRDYPEPTWTTRSTSFTLVYVGGISFLRGLDTMVDSAQAADSDIGLRLAGTVEPGATGYLNTVQNTKIDYLGLLPPPEVPSLLQRSSAGMVVLRPIPNYINSQPTKLFEYMASGIPFVASNFPYWRKLVGDGCGVWVDPESVDSVARGIQELAGDSSVAEAMGLNGRRLMEERFNYEAESRVLVKMMNSLFDEPSSRRG